VIDPGPSGVSQLNGKELDDEEVIICPACPAHEAIVLQANARIGFAIIFDDIIWCPKMFRETHAMHATPECLGHWPIGAKAVLFMVVVPATTRVACVVLITCPLIPPYVPDDALEA
jgi:hypothetical protein